VGYGTKQIKALRAIAHESADSNLASSRRFPEALILHVDLFARGNRHYARRR
jgi:hypothetical protein